MSRLSVSRLDMSMPGVSRMCVSGLVNTMDRKMQEDLCRFAA